MAEFNRGRANREFELMFGSSGCTSHGILPSERDDIGYPRQHPQGEPFGYVIVDLRAEKIIDYVLTGGSNDTRDKHKEEKKAVEEGH